MLTRRFLFTAGSTTLLLSACATKPEVTADGRFPILAVIDAQPDLRQFRLALARSGVDQTLSGHGPFTVLAPTDAAWASAPAAIREGRPEALRNLIAHGRLRVPDIEAREPRPVQMIGGANLRAVGGTPQTLRIQTAAAGGQPSGPSATIVRPNLLASNGVIHVVDAVLVPTGA